MAFTPKFFSFNGGSTRRSKRTLSLIIFCFCIAIFLPLCVLVFQAYKQLQWESFHQAQKQAAEFSIRITEKFERIIANEESRTIGEYQFILAEGDITNNYIRRSPLSTFPNQMKLPGILGYFQIDSEGRFSTPILPNRILEAPKYGISEAQLGKRMEVRNALFKILIQNNLLSETSRPQNISKKTQEPLAPITEGSSPPDQAPMPASEPTSSFSGFDALEKPKNTFERNKSRRVKPVTFSDSDTPKSVEPLRRREKGVIPELIPEEEAEKQAAKKKERKVSRAEKQSQRTQNFDTDSLREVKNTIAQNSLLPQLSPIVKIKIFEAEIDPFKISLLNNTHFVLYRQIWKNGERLIQGFLINKETLFTHTIRPAFIRSNLSKMTNLSLVFDDTTIHQIIPSSDAKSYPTESPLLYRTQLPPPFNGIDLVFHTTDLPTGPGANVIFAALFATICVLLVGGWGFYRLGVRQILLTQQQQDFVSSVSHELKTPLTSIKMYGEILKQGWAGEEKRLEYYNFIHDESERLTRLINNVLQLARLNRNTISADLKPTSVEQIQATIQAKIASQIERAEFSLHLNHDTSINETLLSIDDDLLTQIMINLVDNAIKFSRSVKKKAIDISIQESTHKKNHIDIAIRDYGPGIPESQLKKIFTLFYRVENELTRETQGTGIGLALVKQLAQSMFANIQIKNTKPGLMVTVTFKVTQ